MYSLDKLTLYYYDLIERFLEHLNSLGKLFNILIYTPICIHEHTIEMLKLYLTLIWLTKGLRK